MDICEIPIWAGRVSGYLTAKLPRARIQVMIPTTKGRYTHLMVRLTQENWSMERVISFEMLEKTRVWPQILDALAAKFEREMKSCNTSIH